MLYTMKIPIVDGMGAPVYLLGISLDVTDRLRAERELEHLRAEWGSIVAHDLRQPLQSIAMSAQVLARTTSDARAPEVHRAHPVVDRAPAAHGRRF